MHNPLLILTVTQLVSDYLASRIDFHAFNERFVAATFNADLPAGHPTAETIGEMELRIAEYTSGHWTERELRNHLSPLVAITSTAITAGAGSFTTPQMPLRNVGSNRRA